MGGKKKGQASVLPPADAPEKAEVMGIEFEIDRDALASWEAFKLVERMDSGNPMSAARASVDFAALVCGLDEASIVEACGGGKASARDVLTFARRAIEACKAKN